MDNNIFSFNSPLFSSTTHPHYSTSKSSVKIHEDNSLSYLTNDNNIRNDKDDQTAWLENILKSSPLSSSIDIEQNDDKFCAQFSSEHNVHVNDFSDIYSSDNRFSEENTNMSDHNMNTTEFHHSNLLHEINLISPDNQVHDFKLDSDRELIKKSKKKKYHNKLPDHATNLMLKWWNEHISHPYPNDHEKEFFSLNGQITDLQVRQWFANRRSRLANKNKKNKQSLPSQLLTFPPTSYSVKYPTGDLYLLKNTHSKDKQNHINNNGIKYSSELTKLHQQQQLLSPIHIHHMQQKSSIDNCYTVQNLLLDKSYQPICNCYALNQHQHQQQQQQRCFDLSPITARLPDILTRNDLDFNQYEPPDCYPYPKTNNNYCPIPATPISPSPTFNININNESLKQLIIENLTKILCENNICKNHEVQL
ncbi:unnamed protein product [Didymodactylos carnosus]|uniref:Homeobox domain-containing protein n=1 Tax=Didymodactylos carnosus TaxID=1234261 RepID=A0A815HJQ9_9BILA|nr:unnamed protein product [Didymodactylos carnosus]CAF1405387.1 unnamed protein product [Didymodactylos carnosus]CAF4211173.1 unnamed protein product [Didymodactylos carnosus]CAF4224091.1 unnamed protein product [Didymodactylos carnosus]